MPSLMGRERSDKPIGGRVRQGCCNIFLHSQSYIHTHSLLTAAMEYVGQACIAILHQRSFSRMQLFPFRYIANARTMRALTLPVAVETFGRNLISLCVKQKDSTAR